MLLLLAIACAPPPAGAPSGAAVVFDAPARQPYPSAYGQHHATVALAPDGRALAAFQHGDWVAGAPLPGEPAPLFWPNAANHPQVARGRDGFVVVATLPAGGLATARTGWDGVPVGDVAVLGEGPSLYPDLALADGDVGVLTFADGPNVQLRRFADDLHDVVELPAIPAALGAAGTPTVRATADGFRLAWSEADDLGGTVVTASLDADGLLVGAPEVAVSLDEADGRPTVAIGTSGWALAWREGHDGADPEAWVRFHDLDDVVLADVPLHGLDPARRPAVDAAADVAVVAWERVVDGVAAIWVQPWDLARAAPLADAVRASPRDGRHHHRPYVAVDVVEGAVVGVLAWERLTVVDPADELVHRDVLTRPFHLGSP